MESSEAEEGGGEDGDGGPKSGDLFGSDSEEADDGSESSEEEDGEGEDEE